MSQIEPEISRSESYADNVQRSIHIKHSNEIGGVLTLKHSSQHISQAQISKVLTNKNDSNYDEIPDNLRSHSNLNPVSSFVPSNVINDDLAYVSNSVVKNNLNDNFQSNNNTTGTIIQRNSESKVNTQNSLQNSIQQIQPDNNEQQRYETELTSYNMIAEPLKQTGANFQPYKRLFKSKIGGRHKSVDNIKKTSSGAYSFKNDANHYRKSNDSVFKRNKKQYEVLISPVESQQLSMNEIINEQQWITKQYQASNINQQQTQAASNQKCVNLSSLNRYKQQKRKSQKYNSNSFIDQQQRDEALRQLKDEIIKYGNANGQDYQLFQLDQKQQQDQQDANQQMKNVDTQTNDEQNQFTSFSQINNHQYDQKNHQMIVDIQQIIYPPEKTARQINILQNLQVPTRNPIVANALTQNKNMQMVNNKKQDTGQVLAGQAKKQRSVSSKLLQQKNNEQCFKIDSNVNLNTRKQIYQQFNNDGEVTLLKNRKSFLLTHSSSRFQANDQMSTDHDKESVTAHLIHLNKLINQRSESTVGEFRNNVLTQQQESTGMIQENLGSIQKDKLSMGMQSYSLFPQTARGGLSFQYQRPRSSQLLVNINKDITMTQVGHSANPLSKSSISTRMFKQGNDKRAKTKIMSRYANAQYQLNAVFQAKNIQDYSNEEYQDYIKYLKTDNYYDGMFAARLQQALSFELENKRKEILKSNEEEMRYKFKNAKSLKINVNNIHLNDFDAITDVHIVSPQNLTEQPCMKGQQLRESDMDDIPASLKRQMDLQFRNCSDDLLQNHMELTKAAEDGQLELVHSNVVTSPQSQIMTQEKKTETTEVKDKNISIKDIGIDAEIIQSQIPSETQKENQSSTKSKLDKFIENVQSEYANSNMNPHQNALKKYVEEAAYQIQSNQESDSQDFGIYPGFYILNAGNINLNQENKHSDIIGGKFKPKKNRLHSPLFRQQHSDFSKFGQQPQQVYEVTKFESQITESPFEDPQAVQNKQTGVEGSLINIYNKQQVNTEQQVVTQTNSPINQQEIDSPDKLQPPPAETYINKNSEAESQNTASKRGKTQIIYSQASREKPPDTPQMGYFVENEPEKVAVQEEMEASDGTVINIRSRTTFEDHVQSKSRKKFNMRKRRMTYQVASRNLASQIIHEVKRNQIDLNPTILSPNYARIVSYMQNLTPQNALNQNFQKSGLLSYEESKGDTSKSKKVIMHQNRPIISSRPMSATPGIIYDGRSYKIRHDGCSLSTPKVLSRQFSALSKFRSPVQSNRMLSKSVTSQKENNSQINENLELLSQIVNFDQRSQSTDEFVNSMNNDIKLNPMGISKPSFSNDSPGLGNSSKLLLGKMRPPTYTEDNFDYSQYAYEKYQRYRIFKTNQDSKIPRHQRSTSSFNTKKVPERIKPFEMFAGNSENRLPHSRIEKYIKIDPQTNSLVNIKELSKSPSRYFERNFSAHRRSQENSSQEVISQIWQHKDRQKPKVNGKQMYMYQKPRRNSYYVESYQNKGQSMPENHSFIQFKSDMLQNDDLMMTSWYGDEQITEGDELKIFGFKPTIEDRRMLHYLFLQNQNQIETENKIKDDQIVKKQKTTIPCIQMFKKKNSADISTVMTPNDYSKNNVRPWSHHRSYNSLEKSKDKNSQGLRKTLSTVGTLHQKQIIQDPFLNIMNPGQRLADSQDVQIIQLVNSKSRSKSNLSPNDTNSQRQLAQAISKQKIDITEMSPPDQQLKKQFSNQHPSITNLIAQEKMEQTNLQMMANNTIAQIMNNPEGFESNPTQLSYQGYLQQRSRLQSVLNYSQQISQSNQRNQNAISEQNSSFGIKRDSQSKLPKNSDKSKILDQKDQKTALNSQLENLRKLQEIKRKRNRRIASDVQKALNSQPKFSVLSQNSLIPNTPSYVPPHTATADKSNNINNSMKKKEKNFLAGKQSVQLLGSRASRLSQVASGNERAACRTSTAMSYASYGDGSAVKQFMSPSHQHLQQMSKSNQEHMNEFRNMININIGKRIINDGGI